MKGRAFTYEALLCSGVAHCECTAHLLLLEMSLHLAGRPSCAFPPHCATSLRTARHCSRVFPSWQMFVVQLGTIFTLILKDVFRELEMPKTVVATIMTFNQSFSLLFGKRHQNSNTCSGVGSSYTYMMSVNLFVDESLSRCFRFQDSSPGLWFVDSGTGKSPSSALS